MLSLTYTTSAADFDSYLRHRAAPGRRMLRGSALAVALGGMTYLFLLFDGQGSIASLVPSLAIVFVVVLFLWSQIRSQYAIQRKANTDAKYWVMGEQNLTLSESGLTHTSAAGKVQKGWSSLAEALATSSHVFLIFPHGYSWIVPTGTLANGVSQQLFEALNRHATRFKHVR